VSDTTTGSPVTGAKPAAWIDPMRGSLSCAEKVKDFLAGSVFSRAELDLNSFYVLALNQDATVTVVDPLFGYGGTKLLAMVQLKSPGLDWALTPDQSRLFVSMPDSNGVAAVDTRSWKVLANADIPGHPGRLAMQPDGRLVWVGRDAGVSAIDAANLRLVGALNTGRGAHEIAFSGDSRFLFITNHDDATVSIVDTLSLEKVADLRVGKEPRSIAWSPLSHTAWVASADGTIVAVDAATRAIVSTVQTKPGIAQMRFAPGGRLGFIANPEKNTVQILDAATGRIIQTADMNSGPDQIAFSETLAYVRRRGSETVFMIPLAEVGQDGRPVPAADLPAGQSPLGKTTLPSLADALVEVPGANAVLVTNPADKAIYYYKEGMAAPMGNFSNYDREPRAALVVDRSLRERAPGVYETTARLAPGAPRKLAFLLDAPRFIDCFDLPAIEGSEVTANHPIRIEPVAASRTVEVGDRVHLRFRLSDSVTRETKNGAGDVRVLAFLAPGIWQARFAAAPSGDGLYDAEFAPPKAGIYYVYVSSAALGIPFDNPQYLVIEAKNPVGGSK
jgi:DNA-binding beta-propeller fold protein YncE